MDERKTYPRFPKVLAYELTEDLVLRVWGYGDTEQEAREDAAVYLPIAVPLHTKHLDPETSAAIDKLLQERVRANQ